MLGTDETPAPLTTAATSAEGCGNPHVYTVRTMLAWTGGGADLIWYGAAGNRTKQAITGFGILDGYRGVLVRDDYGGYLSYDAGLAGVQQCVAHLYRYLDDAYATDPVSQAWTRQAGDALRRRQGRPRCPPGQPGARPAGRAAPQLRPGRRLRDLREPVPALAQGQPPRAGPGPAAETQGRPGMAIRDPLRRPGHNNGSENAVRGYKLAAEISGCWRTLQRHCRIRSYLTTARSHGHHPLAAIRDAVSGNCWMPPQPA